MADVQWAVGDWHMEAVGPLLRRNGIDPETKDIRGQSQLGGL